MLFKQGLGFLETFELGVVVVPDRGETLGLQQDCVADEKAEDKPDAPPQPGIRGELREERTKRARRSLSFPHCQGNLKAILTGARFGLDLREQRHRLKRADVSDGIGVPILDRYRELSLLVAPFA